MMRYILLVIAFFMFAPVNEAHADIEFVQKIQNMLGKIQQKAKEVQEKIEKVKAEIMSKVQAVKDAKSKVEGGMKQLKAGNIKDLKKLNTVADGLKDVDFKKDKDAGSKAIEENFTTPEEGGDSVEKQKELDEYIQEVLRDSYSKLYAVAYATRANFTKEEPRDVDMSATDQILMEANMKAASCVERMAIIYVLESMIQSSKYIETMSTVKINASTEEEKK